MTRLKAGYRARGLVVAALALALSQPSIVAGAQPKLPSLADATPGKAIVRFGHHVKQSQRAASLRKAGVTLDRNLLVRDYALVRFAAPIKDALTRLLNQGGIESAEPDYVAHLAVDAPNDPCLLNTTKNLYCPSTAWHLQAIEAQGGWNRYPNQFFTPATPKPALPAASRIKIAVIDTPILRGSPDFRNGSSSDDIAFGGQLDIASMAAFPNGLQPEGGSWSFHGSYVAGILAATANNSYATAGVAYGADLLPLPAVHGTSGAADAGIVADAIVFARDHGARIINMSLGLTQPSSAVYSAIQDVIGGSNPSLVVAAAGNNTGSNPFYPAWFDGVMAVGGTDQFDRKAECANYSSHTSVAAPARQVQSLSDNSSVPMIAPDCGTSAATPQVSALAALLMSQDPARTPDVVRTIIEHTADDLGDPGRDDFFGYGRINVDRALAFGANIADTHDATATVARAGGGVSHITATATSESQIVAAEMFVDRVPAGPSDRGFPVSAADGAFDSTAESLTATLATQNIASGTHRVLMRSLDTSGQWGILASTAVYIDPFPPTITALAASDTYRVLDALNPAAGQAVIGFIDGDEYSHTIDYDVTITNAITGGVAWHPPRVSAPSGERSLIWSPQTTDLPGRYNVRVVVRDEAGNTAAATTAMTLL